MKSLARALIRDRQQNAGADTAFGRQSASPSHPPLPVQLSSAVRLQTKGEKVARLIDIRTG